jgi:hypothetical protein
MQHPGFFEHAGSFALREIAEKIGAALSREEDGSRKIGDVQPLRTAGPGDLASVVELRGARAAPEDKRDVASGRQAYRVSLLRPDRVVGGSRGAARSVSV